MSAFLLGNIIFAALWLILFFASPKTRKLQLFGSLLLLPFGFLDIWFCVDYWHPPVLIKAIEPLSIETMIYCFSVGGIASVFGGLFLKSNLGVKKIDIKKLLIFFVISFSFYAIFQSIIKVNSMNALNFSFLLIWLAILIRAIKKYWISIIPGIIVAAFTILAVNIGLYFYPNFVAAYWNLNHMWPLFLRTPTEEILFGFILASLWTLLPSYLVKK
ncbi:MAG: hypothetical protein NT039_01895 [Candidatus Berkelbacteria bacterium]|nr:hypothetical protein [Candidatus Berkelbacteria bacterium]